VHKVRSLFKRRTFLLLFGRFWSRTASAILLSNLFVELLQLLSNFQFFILVLEIQLRLILFQFSFWFDVRFDDFVNLWTTYAFLHRSDNLLRPLHWGWGLRSFPRPRHFSRHNCLHLWGLWSLGSLKYALYLLNLIESKFFHRHLPRHIIALLAFAGQLNVWRYSHLWFFYLETYNLRLRWLWDYFWQVDQNLCLLLQWHVLCTLGFLSPRSWRIIFFFIDSIN
jgi:hypothetical protein